MNMLEARLERSNGSLAVKAGSQSIALGDEVERVRPALRSYEGREVVLGIRPEDLDDASLVSDSSSDRCLKGEVQLREALGSEVMVHFTIDARPAMTEDVRELARDVRGEEADEAGQPAGETTLVGRFGARSRVHTGETISISVDTRSLHFFDPETGLGIYDGHEKGTS